MKSAKTNEKTGGAALADPLAPATVGFRLLEESDRRELAERARKYGTTPHEVARSYVIAALHSKEEIPELQSAVAMLHQEILQLRKDTARAAEMILLSLDKDTPENVRAWIKTHFAAE